MFAQTPHTVRGLTTGLTALSAGLSSFFGYGVRKLVSAIFSSMDSWFVSNITVFVASAVYLILFVCFSKYYKLQKRDGIVPIHLFAEEYLEKKTEGRRSLENEVS